LRYAKIDDDTKEADDSGEVIGKESDNSGENINGDRDIPMPDA
jgi:hypothetical protein